jgi:hypothetical protein
MPNLHIKKFDISKISCDKIVYFLARRNAGKSCLIRDIMFHNTDIPVGMVVSPTEDSNRFYGDFIPSVFIHTDWTPELTANFVKRQRLIMNKYRNEIQTEGSSTIDPRAFLILDDSMYDTSWTADKDIRFLHCNGRHIKTLLMITLQYPMGVPPTLRAQIDYTFILRETNIGNRKRIYENYAGVFPSFDMFCQVMNQCTNNYECLVIDNTTKSGKLEDQIFWYKGELNRPHFRVGAPQFWSMSKQQSEDYLDEDPDSSMIDLSALKSKRTPIITVKKRD